MGCLKENVFKQKTHGECLCFEKRVTPNWPSHEVPFWKDTTLDNDFFALSCFFPHHHHQHLRIRSSFNSPWVSLTHSQLTKIHQTVGLMTFPPPFCWTGPAASVTPVQCAAMYSAKDPNFGRQPGLRAEEVWVLQGRVKGYFTPGKPIYFRPFKGGYNSIYKGYDPSYPFLRPFIGSYNSI